jgi:LacI family transcriptional regulator
VSPAVVSYVLNDGPRPVSETTRAKVLRVVADLGYRPNHAARSLRLHRTATLGLLVPDNVNPFFAELAKAVEDEAFARGYAILLGNSSDDRHREDAYLRTFLDRQVDGLIVVNATSSAHLDAVLASGTPVVLLDRPPRRTRLPSVAVDNVGGAAAATRHLVEHGHERIACITGPRPLRAAAERRNGWAAALRRAGRPVPSELEINAPFSRQGGFDAAMIAFSVRPAPTALFVGSDLQAVAVLHAARVRGIRVPEDLAVVSFDGTLESSYSLPPMTTIRQPVEQLARLGIDRLVDPAATDDLHAVVTYELIVRRSCGCDTIAI